MYAIFSGVVDTTSGRKTVSQDLATPGGCATREGDLTPDSLLKNGLWIVHLHYPSMKCPQLAYFAI